MLKKVLLSLALVFTVLCAPARADLAPTQTFPIPQGTVAVYTISTHRGFLFNYAVTTTGTSGVITCYDNASAASGTAILTISGVAAVGLVQQVIMPVQNGITCNVPSTGSAAVTISYI